MKGFLKMIEAILASVILFTLVLYVSDFQNDVNWGEGILKSTSYDILNSIER